MGDKGGKKDKNKRQKQDESKRKQKAKKYNCYTANHSCDNYVFFSFNSSTHI